MFMQRENVDKCVRSNYKIFSDFGASDLIRRATQLKMAPMRRV